MNKLMNRLTWCVLGLTTLGMAASAVAQDKPALGLGERRAIKKYQDETYPALLKAIQDAAGFPLEVEVQWEVIAQLGQADLYSDPGYWTQIYFQPLAAAMASITQDQMGKDALKAGLKKVVITYDAATAPATNYPDGITVADGVLTINFAPYSNAGDESSANFKERVDAIKKGVEAKL
jgi:hypothetical protein